MEPSFAERTVIKHSDYLTNVLIVVSTATNVTESEVFTADGHSFAYDYLVVATGHKDSFPRTRSERLSQYESGEHKNALDRSISIFCFALLNIYNKNLGA